MNISRFFPQEIHALEFKQLDTKKPLVLSGVSNITSKSYLISTLKRQRKFKNIFWVTNDNKEIYELKNNLSFWMDDTVLALDNLSKVEQSDAYKMTELVTTLAGNDQGVYLVNHKEASHPIPTYQAVREAGLTIEKGEDMRVVEFFNELINMGYYPSADVVLRKGECRRSGGVINVFPPNSLSTIKIEVDYDKISGIWHYNQDSKNLGEAIRTLEILPINVKGESSGILNHVTSEDLVIIDDLDETAEFDAQIDKIEGCKVIFTSFPKSDEDYHHFRYLSVLKYYNIFDLLNDLRDKIQREWKINIFTKRTKELINIFTEENIRYGTQVDSDANIILIDAEALENVPASFQAPQEKIQFLTDKEIFNLSRTSKNQSVQKINLDFLTGLRVGDLVIHLDHGIGRFLGVVPKIIDEIKREYLEIAYAENDRLFVPIDQADKLSKYVGGEENEPQLSRLGGSEWRNVSQKIKKETQKIAKELLKLYAERAQVKGHNYGPDTDIQRAFEKAFPYEETPGQMKAIMDVKKDMESDQPMDRLVCGDVGFGKTEVAMRAAMKAVQGGKQVAFIAPITILADQHYKSFKKRALDTGVRLEMLSRFRTPAQQKMILEKLRKGDIDVLIGTHRLLQDDVKFFNLGLVVIDEEQRFGVKQKERFKSIRSQVDILTLTATPIPRTLNLALNNFRDISTITTPPPGRLPIITEVRRYSDNLIKEAINREVERGGKVFFLHNRVRSIESIADKLRKIMPHIKFIVAHGQLAPQELEERILKFKEGDYQVLISSTIIENGIDLPTANTLIVDNAENLGLSQMYQLRGRVGRGKRQAYAYFLYQARQLRLDAKKRLKAIVDASELGAGFQVAMRDLEIRGAGDILGVNQHGTIKVVGMSHFLRMLNKTVEELRAGKTISEESNIQDISIELPIAAYIPDAYIPDTKDKINTYQKLSSVDSMSLLNELKQDLTAEYGHLPKEVSNLFQILAIKMKARKVGLLNIKSVIMGKGREIILHMNSSVTAEQIMNLLKHSPKWFISGDKLKIDMKELGFKWLERLKENIGYLDIPVKKIEKSTHGNSE